MGWYEWSANPTLHITDRLGWQQANPSMGILMDESVLEQHLLSDRIETFKTEALCLWVDALESPWQEGSFAACQDTNLVLIPGRTTWLAWADALLANPAAHLWLVETWLERYWRPAVESNPDLATADDPVHMCFGNAFEVPDQVIVQALTGRLFIDGEPFHFQGDRSWVAPYNVFHQRLVVSS
jgi:hypothetical protein